MKKYVGVVGDTVESIKEVTVEETFVVSPWGDYYVPASNSIDTLFYPNVGDCVYKLVNGVLYKTDLVVTNVTFESAY